MSYSNVNALSADLAVERHSKHSIENGVDVAQLTSSYSRRRCQTAETHTGTREDDRMWFNM